jgi:hypothetical protein
MSGHLFENPRMGVPRSVYWTCNVQFAPIVEDSDGTDEDHEGWPCTLLVDWITWPVRSWKEIDGLTLANCVGPLEPEASLYFFGQHQPLSSIELSFRRLFANHFSVQGRFMADLADLEGRILRQVTAEFEVKAEFAGLSVLPDNLFPKPKLEAEAAEVLGKFADLEIYEQPQWGEMSWLFRPRV